MKKANTLQEQLEKLGKANYARDKLEKQWLDVRDYARDKLEKQWFDVREERKIHADAEKTALDKYYQAQKLVMILEKEIYDL